MEYLKSTKVILEKLTNKEDIIKVYYKEEWETLEEFVKRVNDELNNLLLD